MTDIDLKELEEVLSGYSADKDDWKYDPEWQSFIIHQAARAYVAQQKAMPDDALNALNILCVHACSDKAPFPTALIAIEKGKETIIAALQNAAPQSIPDGYKLVPIEPTEEMIKAAVKAFNAVMIDDVNDTKAIAAEYKAMLAAAPELK